MLSANPLKSHAHSAMSSIFYELKVQQVAACNVNSLCLVTYSKLF